MTRILRGTEKSHDFCLGGWNKLGYSSMYFSIAR